MVRPGPQCTAGTPGTTRPRTPLAFAADLPLNARTLEKHDRRPDPTRTANPEVVLHQQRLVSGTRRVASERVVVRRRVVTETRQVQVTVRRELLEVERIPLPDTDSDSTRGLGTGLGGTPPAGGDGPGAAPWLVVVLREEVPVVQVLTRPYEQVTVSVHTVSGTQELTATVQAEHAEVSELPGQARRP